jgi:LuxR family transcriptional regulator
MLVYKTERLSAALASLIKATSIAGAWRVFCDEMTHLGYDTLVYGGSLQTPSGHRARPDETLILMNGPDAWAEPYISEKLYLKSLTFEWAARNEGFVTWQDALRQFGVHPSPKQIQLFDLNERFEFRGGMIGSLRNLVPGKHGIIGMSGPNGESHEVNEAHWNNVAPFVTMLCETFHLRVVSLPQTGIFQPLTTRQLEVLFWYGEGKMLQDIATIMDIRVGTVEKHLRMARVALAADTTAHAVRKATALNLLTA